MSDNSSKDKYPHIVTYRHQEALRGIAGPYYPFVTLDEFTEVTVTSHGISMSEDTELEVLVERAKKSGFARLRVDIPSMDIIECIDITEDEFRKFMQFIGSHMNVLYETVECRQSEDDKSADKKGIREEQIMVSLNWTASVARSFVRNCSYNKDALIGLEYKLYRAGSWVIFQGYGMDDTYVKFEKIAVQTDVNKPYYQLSEDDDFKQGHDVVINDIGLDGTFFVLDSTWKPHPFALLPERVRITTHVDAYQASGKFYMWYDGRSHVQFIDKAGNWFSVPRSCVKISNRKSIVPMMWYEVTVDESNSVHNIVTIIGTKIPNLKQYIKKN